MLDAEYICSEVFPFFELEAREELKGIEFYLRTLEDFINSQREREVDSLREQYEALPEDARGEFWAWNYPVYWDEIFASQLRTSFVITLVSFTESHLGTVTDHACTVANSMFKPKELQGGDFEKRRKCLERMCRFSLPDNESWRAILAIRDVRNCIVHAASRIYESKKKERLTQLVGELPGLSASHDILEFSEDFPIYAFGCVDRFVSELYKEARTLCERHNSWREKPD